MGNQIIYFIFIFIYHDVACFSFKIVVGSVNGVVGVEGNADY